MNKRITQLALSMSIGVAILLLLLLVKIGSNGGESKLLHSSDSLAHSSGGGSSPAESCEDIKFNITHKSAKNKAGKKLGSPTTSYRFVPKEWLWRHYRLGDAIRGLGNLTSEYICERWPGSLACRYRSATDRPKNIDVLNGLIEKVTVDITAVHVRLGDVMTSPKCWEELCSATKRAKHFVATKEMYKSIIAKIPKNDPVVFVGSPYHHSNKTRINYSLLYLRKVVCFFRQQGFKASYNGDTIPPDDDFILLSTAKTFVQGGGGFSQLVSNIAKQRNHKVITMKIFSNHRNKLRSA